MRRPSKWAMEKVCTALEEHPYSNIGILWKATGLQESTILAALHFLEIDKKLGAFMRHGTIYYALYNWNVEGVTCSGQMQQKAS